MVVTPPDESYLPELLPGGSPAALRVLALHDLGTEAHGILEVRPGADELRSLLRNLGEIEAITSWDVLYSDTDVGLVEYMTRDPSLYVAALEAKIVPIFPVQIRDGQLFVEITASYDQLSRFGDVLEEIGASYDMLSIRHSSNISDLLTVRQQQFVVEAVERGYYDTPRECTLTELAEDLNVTKGAASRLFHRAEERIVKEFVATLPGKSVEHSI